MTRQIIQITTATMVIGKVPTAYLIALCDDGTIWSMANREGGKWIRLMDIPQPVEATA